MYMLFTLCVVYISNSLVHINVVNLGEHGAKVGTVQVKSSQHSWTGQYKKCVQYNFKFSSEWCDCICGSSCMLCIYDYEVHPVCYVCMYMWFTLHVMYICICGSPCMLCIYVYVVHPVYYVYMYTWFTLYVMFI